MRDLKDLSNCLTLRQREAMLEGELEDMSD